MEESFHLGLKALIRNEKGQILVLNANMNTFPKDTEAFWDLPGGRIKKGEDLETGLRREVEEEIGIKDLEIGELLDASISKTRIQKLDVSLILFTFLCSTPSAGDIRLTDNEHIGYKWVKPQEAAKLLSKKFADSLIKKLEEL